MLTTLLETSGTTSQKVGTVDGIRIAKNKEVRKMVILLVEDTDMVTFAVKQLLSRSGHDVLSAKDGVEAMEILSEKEFQIDYLITDLDMPRLDGMGLLEMVKGWNFTKWMFSGSIDDEGARKAIALGASKVVWKMEIFSELRKASLI
jgi:CheY-like chemotaxis protein